MRILIAEDNTVMGHVLQFNLQRAGFTAEVAPNGQAAFEVLQENDFDLVITDYQMPKMTGEELLRAMRDLPRHRDTPAVLCSAKGYEIDVEYFVASLDVKEIVYKPFSPRQMVEMACRLIGKPETVSV
jgi:CheY-like chemotaxis protein